MCRSLVVSQFAGSPTYMRGEVDIQSCSNMSYHQHSCLHLLAQIDRLCRAQCEDDLWGNSNQATSGFIIQLPGLNCTQKAFII